MRRPIAAHSRAAVLVVVALCMPFASFAQEPTPARSTLNGVYTEEQATRGRDVYGSMCISCHTLASHTGTPFRNSWVGRLLSELFQFIQETMPDGAGGTLTPDETAVIVAYLLQLNGFPAGTEPLPSDSALKTIRFDTAAPPQQDLLRLR